MIVTWTPEAKTTFNSNIDFLLAEWGERVTSDFIDRVDEVIQNIAKNPRLYPLINEKDLVHRCVVVKQITLYYRIKTAEQIDLLTFWNSYQNPEFLSL
jgi:plasmid stabilization system protein ParE